MSVRGLAVALAVATAVMGGLSCQSELTAVPCGEIPAGGCPRRGDACRDPACAALYMCRADGTWRLEEPCANDAAGRDASRAADASSEATLPRDAAFDVQGASGGPGCGELDVPDCSLALASACGAGCCGCEDVFVCAGDGSGWELWGRCGDAGVVPER